MALESIWKKLDIYSWMIVVLSVFTAAGIYTFGWQQTLPQTIIAVVAANAFDILAKYFKTKQFRFTKSATITGLFIGLLLPFSSQLYLPVIAAVIAIASKHLINWKGRHIFNPTLFSLLIVSLIFNVQASWWGSFAFPTQQIPYLNLLIVAILGFIITAKQRRHDLVWPFIGAFLLFTFIGRLFLPDQAEVVYLGLDSTLLFAVFFMLVEPKTSPFFARARLAYGILSAAIFAVFSLFALGYYPLGAILIANLFVLVLDKYFKGSLWQSSSKLQTSQT